MLPEGYLQRYRNLYQDCQQLQQQCNSQLTPQQTRGSSEIQTSFQQMQQEFQQILALNWEAIDPLKATSAQSINIEINKQLRLLSMDLMFLNSARQSATATQRQQQLLDRINLLLRYCETILQGE